MSENSLASPGRRAPYLPSILFVSDHPAGGLNCFLSDEEKGRMITCPVREACRTLGCLRQIGLIIVSMDCVTREEVVTITDWARDACVPVLMI